MGERERIDARDRSNDSMRVRSRARDAVSENANTNVVASWVALLLVCCAAVVYVWFALRVYRAQRLASHHDPISLQRAIQIQPRDANHYDLLGQYLMWDAQTPQPAATEFKQATRLNPYASSYWMHLAQAENSLGNSTEQATAIRKATAVDAATPELAWSAANYFLIQGDTDEALDQFAVVVRSDPAMAEAALERSWRAVGQVDAIQRRLPADPAVYLSFLKILVAKHQWAQAEQIWSSMLQLHRPFDARAALSYVDGLLAKPDVVEAQRVWQQIVDASPELKSYITPGNLVVNPGFDHEFVNGGFDWHYSGQNGVAMTLDPTQTHDGSEALLITYSGAPNGDAGISQPVPVTPGVSYIASAWVMSQELDTANGPQLAVFDAYSNRALTHSDETLGTTGWHQVEATFTAPNETKLVVIRISREPPSTRIQGKFWIDNVHMVKNIGQSDAVGH